MRLHYVDGLKAIGCFFVFFCHFNGLLHLVSLPKPIAFFNNGEFAVALFLMLSGFSIAMSLDKDDTKILIQRLILGRYLRFALPMAIVSTFAYMVYLVNGFYVSDVAGIIGQSYGSTEYTNIGFRHYIAMLILAPMSYTALNNPLWMMKFIFEGTFVVIILHLGIDKLKLINRFFVTLFAMMLSVMESLYLTDVIAGMLIYEMWKSGILNKISTPLRRMLSLILLFTAYGISVYFHRDAISGASAKTLIILLLGTASLTIGVLMSNIMQHVFSIRPLRFLGGVSFEFYLIHWMIVCSLSRWMWLLGYSSGQNYLIWANFIITTLIVIVLSVLMKRYLEPMICKPVEKAVMKRLLK